MNNKFKCLTCLEEKPKVQFYKSNSKMFAEGIAPYCKECISKNDISDLKVFLKILEQLDVPYVKTIWDDVYSKFTTGQLGRYLRIIAMKMPKQTFSDSPDKQKDIIQKLDDKIEKEKTKLEKLEEKIQKHQQLEEEVKKETKQVIDEAKEVVTILNSEKIDIDAMEKRWGTGFKPIEYLKLEDKFNKILNSVPNANNLHFEAIETYAKYSLRADQAIIDNEPDDAKKWGDLARNIAKQAKITPEQLSLADLSSGGVETIGEIIVAVEQAIDFIPPPLEYIKEPRDKADKMLADMINYLRKIEDRPPLEYEDIYNFINEQADTKVKEFPNTYGWLNDLEVDGNTHLERYHNYLFQVMIPSLKNKYFNDPFYQNLDKWVKFVSFYRWFPDLLFDLVAPLDKFGNKRKSKFTHDQRVFLRSLERFKHTHSVLPRGSGKCVVGDTILFTEKGLMEIGSFLDYRKDDKEFIKNYNIKILNRYGKLEQSPRCIYSGKKDTKKFILEKGYEIEVSLNHKLLINNEEWVVADKVNKDDKLFINLKNNLYGKNCKIPFNPIEYYKKNIKVGALQLFPTFLNTDISFLFGVLFQTYYIENDMVKIKVNSIPLIDKIIKITKENFNINVKIKDDVLIFDNKYFKDYLSIIKLNNKEIPSLILETNKNNFKSFLQGYFNNNFYILPNKLGIKIQKEKISKQVQIMLLNLGVVCDRQFDEKNQVYNIIIEDNYLYEFLQIIPIIDKKIIENLEYSKNSSNDNYLMVKIVDCIFDKKDVYDVYMPNTNSFIGNGIINHNTYLGVCSLIHSSVMYPSLKASVVSTTKKNACSLLSGKFNEIISHYPLLQNEFLPKNKGSIENGGDVRYRSNMEDGCLDTLVNNQTSKGERRHTIIIEESAQINDTLYKDVIEPITAVARVTKGSKGIASPFEIHNKIHFNTTSWFRACAEFTRVKTMLQDMKDAKGCMVLGGSYEINLLAERNYSRSELMKKKEEDPIMFALNFGGDWLGVVDGAIIDIEQLLELRKLENCELQRDTSNNFDYFISVDVARSTKSTNNQSSICVLKVTKRPDGSIKFVDVVYLLNLKGTISFKELSIKIKQLYLKFDPVEIIVDTNGLGVGLLEDLGYPQTDLETGENLVGLSPFNDVLETADSDAVPVVNAFRSQHKNKEIIIEFQKYVESKKLRLLKKIPISLDSTFGSYNKIDEELPFLETDLLVNEISNLKLEISNGNKFTVTQNTKKIDKDRYSALVYGLYNITKHYEIPKKKIETGHYMFIN